MSKPTPIPVAGVPAVVRPVLAMPLTLYWDAREGINWNGFGEPATKARLENVIARCRGQRLPNELLPALDPGDVVVLVDGMFWIDRDWNLQVCDLGGA